MGCGTGCLPRYRSGLQGFLYLPGRIICIRIWHWQWWHYVTRPQLAGSFFTIGMLSVLQIFKSYREIWMVAGSYPQENIYFLQHLLQNWYLKLEFDQMAALTVLLSATLLVLCLILQKRLEPDL